MGDQDDEHRDPAEEVEAGVPERSPMGRASAARKPGGALGEVSDKVIGPWLFRIGRIGSGYSAP